MRSKIVSSAMRLLWLSVFALGFGFAGMWSGTLVDANCSASVERNRNVTDSTTVRDVDMEVRLCSPKARTHSFAILDSDGERVVLDSAGNAKAAELVRQTAERSPLYVSVDGDRNKDTIQVRSIVPAK